MKFIKCENCKKKVFCNGFNEIFMMVDSVNCRPCNMQKDGPHCLKCHDKLLVKHIKEFHYSIDIV